MKKIDQPAVLKAMQSRLVLWSLILLCGCLIIITAIKLTYPPTSKEVIFTDLNVFYIAGQMFWDGTLDQAYHAGAMHEATKQLAGEDTRLIWAYPPQYNFIAAALALLPLGWAYFLFTSFSFWIYLWVLHRLSGTYSSATLFAIAPSLYILIRFGQNGFLTGSLIGLFLLYFLKNRSTAGVPLGLMIIKPHLAIGITMLALISRRWNMMAVAAGVVAVTSLLATLAFGSSIWLAFADGAREANQFLKSALLPLTRNTSIYAVLCTLGIPAGIALAVQSLSFLAAGGLIFYAWAQNWSLPRIAGITALASIFMTPYIYDYDLPVLGLAIALLMPDITLYSSNREKLLLLLLSWITCEWGLLATLVVARSNFPDSQPYSIAGISLLFLLLMILAILNRAIRAEAIQVKTEIAVSHDSA